jgi:cell division protein FtsL
MRIGWPLLCVILTTLILTLTIFLCLEKRQRRKVSQELADLKEQTHEYAVINLDVRNMKMEDLSPFEEVIEENEVYGLVE